MQEARSSLLVDGLGLCALLVPPMVHHAAGAVFWRGPFRVEAANPWKIQIVESYGTGAGLGSSRLRPEKTGLPEVTEEHWVCDGRLPTESDVGQVYHFSGTIPDIGGRFYFSSEEQSLAFYSKWSQPPDWLAPLIGLALLALATAALIAIRWRRRARRKSA